MVGTPTPTPNLVCSAQECIATNLPVAQCFGLAPVDRCACVDAIPAFKRCAAGCYLKARRSICGGVPPPPPPPPPSPPPVRAEPIPPPEDVRTSWCCQRGEKLSLQCRQHFTMCHSLALLLSLPTWEEGGGGLQLSGCDVLGN